ncbi:hypothetical protein SAMN04515620_11134 [Collimonas sp. OK607]|uniref:hypothetical protein n=1 Tax=Collimonas sp. OK607 TaxID=1798194 RepID=UPI0008EC5EF0|nr:hypothetical protein [Collimonas sp. OK607]SFA98945.1 hypothetical protein SAMN04515620_11134 [Collimonas sp. OK607]
MSFYSPLFSIDVEHAFLGATFTCVPTPETADWIRRRDLLVRPQRNGVAVFCEAARRSVLLADCAPGAALLAFKWFAQDPLFSQYTLPLIPTPESLLYLRSGVSIADDSGRHCLHAGETVDAGLMQAMTEPSLARHLDRRDVLCKPVLVAEIDLADHVAGQTTTSGKADEGAAVNVDSVSGVNYYVRFSARKSIWKYYFISNADIDAVNLAVVDLDDTVRFVAAEPEQLPGSRRALVFMSEAEIEMQQKYPQRFQLREQGDMGDRILIRRLANADVSKVTQEMVGGRAALVSEIYIN